MFNWIRRWWTRAEYVEEVVSEELDEAIEEINERLNDDKKKFVLSLTVTSDTKVRKLKTTILDAITVRLAETNPEVKDIDIKLDYQKRK